MKRLILFALLAPVLAAAQDIKEYKATNGVTYHLNDTVRLGKGSNANGTFVYIEDRGAMGLIDLPTLPDPRARSNGRGLQKEFANGGLIIKSIKKIQAKNVDKYVFMVSGAGPFRLNMFIDDAISACEVTPCKASTTDTQSASTAPVASVADEIKKLKELMDSGAISKDEFEKRKKKLLDQ